MNGERSRDSRPDNQSGKPEWFKTWFGPSYKSIYSHRDQVQARTQVEFILDAVPLPESAAILDIGCGAGRHLQVFRDKGYGHAAGFDLSHTLLQDARKSGLAVARADMRSIPFRENHFDLVTCFFTSFGYFATEEQDLSVLNGFAGLLRPDGRLFLDLINREFLMRKFVPYDEKVQGEMTVTQKRRLEGSVVIKDIEILRGGELMEAHQERVRLYSLEEFRRMAAACRLQLQSLFGSEKGDPYHPQESQRMALLLKPSPRA